MSQNESSDPLQLGLNRLEKALNRLEVAAKSRLQSMAAAQSHEVDVNLLNADRQALAREMDEEKAARELSERLRKEALEQVEIAMEMVKSVLYETSGTPSKATTKESANR